jgi:hypothetical protein
VRLFEIWDSGIRELVIERASFAEAQEALCRCGVLRRDTAVDWLRRADDGSGIALNVGGFTILVHDDDADADRPRNSDACPRKWLSSSA